MLWARCGRCGETGDVCELVEERDIRVACVLESNVVLKGLC